MWLGSDFLVPFLIWSHLLWIVYLLSLLYVVSMCRHSSQCVSAPLEFNIASMNIIMKQQILALNVPSSLSNCIYIRGTWIRIFSNWYSSLHLHLRLSRGWQLINVCRHCYCFVFILSSDYRDEMQPSFSLPPDPNRCYIVFESMHVYASLCCLQVLWKPQSELDQWRQESVHFCVCNSCVPSKLQFSIIEVDLIINQWLYVVSMHAIHLIILW